MNLDLPRALLQCLLPALSVIPCGERVAPVPLRHCYGNGTVVLRGGSCNQLELLGLQTLIIRNHVCCSILRTTAVFDCGFNYPSRLGVCLSRL